MHKKIAKHLLSTKSPTKSKGMGMNRPAVALEIAQLLLLLNTYIHTYCIRTCRRIRSCYRTKEKGWGVKQGFISQRDMLMNTRAVFSQLEKKFL
jgi:hypothetical protein